MRFCVLVRLTKTRAARMQRLEENAIPITPLRCTIQLNVPTSDGSSVRQNIVRHQLPITAAYAFTDCRSQGQTLPNVLVDLAAPPSGSFSLFDVYVSLCGSYGRANIRLLRDFDEELLMKAFFEPDLMREDEQLEALNDKCERNLLLSNVR
jgi:hypothetical protein